MLGHADEEEALGLEGGRRGSCPLLVEGAPERSLLDPLLVDLANDDLDAVVVQADVARTVVDVWVTDSSGQRAHYPIECEARAATPAVDVLRQKRALKSKQPSICTHAVVVAEAVAVVLSFAGVACCAA